MTNLKSSLTGLVATMLGLAAATFAGAQTYTPSNWVNDPFCANLNFGAVGANTTSPSFTNNGVQRGTLYGNSPIGTTLKLAASGDAISCTGQVTLAGDINPDGNMQFRLGLYQQGGSTTDTNWLGYTFGNPTGAGAGAKEGLFVRNNPNPGIYSSGSPGNSMRPPCGASAYTAGWAAATYDFSLTVTMLPAGAQGVAWKLAGVAPNQYSYTGSYTNTFPLTVSDSFDQVGFMGGAALFNSATKDDQISFTNITVTLTKAGDKH